MEIIHNEPVSGNVSVRVAKIGAHYYHYFFDAKANQCRSTMAGPGLYANGHSDTAVQYVSKPKTRKEAFARAHNPKPAMFSP